MKRSRSRPNARRCDILGQMSAQHFSVQPALVSCPGLLLALLLTLLSCCVPHAGSCTQRRWQRPPGWQWHRRQEQQRGQPRRRQDDTAGSAFGATRATAGSAASGTAGGAASHPPGQHVPRAAGGPRGHAGVCSGTGVRQAVPAVQVRNEQQRRHLADLISRLVKPVVRLMVAAPVT